MHSGTGDALDMRLAKGAFDETGDAVTLARADQRADLIISIALAGKAQAADGRPQLGDQTIVNARLGIDPASCGAILAGVVIAITAHAFDNGLDIGIVADDYRRLAAKFQVGALEGLGGGLEDFLARDDIAGQRHHAHFRVADQVAPDALATATKNIQNTRRKNLRQGRRQRQDRQRRVFRWLEHQGIARCQGRRDLPGGHHDRVVPGRYGGDHTDRVAAHHAGIARQVLA
ncbi:hypothetical protein D9M71_188140 [compost metagenome]